MNKFFSLTLAGVLAAATLPAAAQTVLVGTGTANASAALQVESTSQGMLVPRMTASQRGLIGTPATGLMVYQTDGTAGFYFYNGTAWTSLSGGGGATLPSQTGNAGSVLTTDGTTASWTSGYGRETLAVLRVPNPLTTSLSYTIPSFANGVTSHTIVITGAWGGGTNTTIHYIDFPDPATVPDGTRVTIKKMSNFESGNGGIIAARYTNWPATSFFDGARTSTGSGNPVLVPTTNALRYAVTYMKVTHFNLASNDPTVNTSIYSDWVPLVGWREQ